MVHKLQKAGSYTLWTLNYILISKWFLTNSECPRSRALTQREETSIEVNLFQLLCCPPPLLTRNNGRQHWKKEHLAAVKTHPFPGWSCWLILGNHNNQEWRMFFSSLLTALSQWLHPLTMVWSVCGLPPPLPSLPLHKGDAVPQGLLKLWSSQPLTVQEGQDAPPQGASGTMRLKKTKL